MNNINSLVSVVVPVFNAETYIAATLSSALNQTHQNLEVLVVDDCSTDNTFKKLEELSAFDKSIIIESHSYNQGKGAAIRTALLSVTGDIVIIQDADLEYNPSEFPKLLKPILAGDADVVYGSRFKSGDAARVIYFWHRLGNLILTFLSNMFTNLNLTDMETCYKVFRKEVLNQITIEETFDWGCLFFKISSFSLFLFLVMSKRNIRFQQSFLMNKVIFFTVLILSISACKFTCCSSNLILICSWINFCAPSVLVRTPRVISCSRFRISSASLFIFSGICLSSFIIVSRCMYASGIGILDATSSSTVFIKAIAFF
jgi:glycosyltransferase involved in cell wall biosynthesis